MIALLLLLQSPDAELLEAVTTKSRERVRAAIKRGASPNAKDASGTPALIWAVRYGRDQGVLELLQNKANPNLADMRGRTPAFWCAFWPRDDVLDFEHEQRKALILEHLIQKGADPNLADSEGVTPLMQAAAKRHDVVLDVLIRAGARLKAKDKRGRNALSWCAWLGPNDPNVQTLLRKMKPGVSELLALGRKDEACRSIQEGGDLGGIGARGENALMLAASIASPMCIKALSKLSPNAKDSAGWTALIYAVAGRPSNSELSGSQDFPNAKPEEPRLKCVQLLIKQGAKPNLKTKDGETALSLAIKCRQTRIAEFLGTVTNS